MAGVTSEQVLQALTAYDATVGDGRTGSRMTAMRAALEAAAAPTPPRRCQARAEGDEMACGRCGTRWQAGDEDPPQCSPVERRVTDRRT